MKRTLAVLSFTAALCTPASALADGFFLYELSPRAVAQGGATAAEGKEPATLAFNPAGMARLDGLQLQANLYTYIAANDFETPSGEEIDADTGFFPIPSGFVTWKPNEWFAAGIGSYSIYGLTIDWPTRWAGYQIIKRASLRSYQLQPTIALGPFKGLSAGVGLDVIFGGVELSRGLPLGSGQWGESKIGGQTTGYGVTAGLFYEAAKWMNLGVSYRSKVKMNLDDGKVDFTVPAAFDQLLRDQSVRTSLNLPTIINAGVRVIPSEHVAVEFDLTYLGWNSYDRLVFMFDDPQLNMTQNPDWHSAFEYRIGTELTFDKLAVRGGFLFDQTPIPDETLDPLLPDNHRLIPSIGAGYEFAKAFRADAAYQFVYLLPRTVDASENAFPGTYRSIVNTIVLGVTAKL